MRWGITTEQAAEGKALPLCLEEIHRCRPYFIGLLGERYGWVPRPDSIPAELLESQPWLKQHLDHSVTELEILHGVFSEELMHGHAYFYFRDPKYLESILSEKRHDFIRRAPMPPGNLKSSDRRFGVRMTNKFVNSTRTIRLQNNLVNGFWKTSRSSLTSSTRKIRRQMRIDQEAARRNIPRSRRLAFIGRDDLLRHLTEYAPSRQTSRPHRRIQLRQIRAARRVGSPLAQGSS